MSYEGLTAYEVGAGIRHVGRIHDEGLLGARVLADRTSGGFRTDLLDLVRFWGEDDKPSDEWVVSRQALRNFAVRESGGIRVAREKTRANTVYTGLAEHIVHAHLGRPYYVSGERFSDSKEAHVDPCHCPVHGKTTGSFRTPNLGTTYWQPREIFITPESLVQAWLKDRLVTIPARTGSRYVNRSWAGGKWGARRHFVPGKFVYGSSMQLHETTAFPVLEDYVRTLISTREEPDDQSQLQLEL